MVCCLSSLNLWFNGWETLNSWHNLLGQFLSHDELLNLHRAQYQPRNIFPPIKLTVFSEGSIILLPNLSGTALWFVHYWIPVIPFSLSVCHSCSGFHRKVWSLRQQSTIHHNLDQLQNPHTAQSISLSLNGLEWPQIFSVLFRISPKFKEAQHALLQFLSDRSYNGKLPTGLLEMPPWSQVSIFLWGLSPNLWLFWMLLRHLQ